MTPRMENMTTPTPWKPWKIHTPASLLCQTNKVRLPNGRRARNAHWNHVACNQLSLTQNLSVSNPGSSRTRSRRTPCFWHLAVPVYIARLRLQLLAAWTTTLKRIGKRLIAFMLSVFKPVYDEEEVRITPSGHMCYSEAFEIGLNLLTLFKIWSKESSMEKIRHKFVPRTSVSIVFNKWTRNLSFSPIFKTNKNAIISIQPSHGSSHYLLKNLSSSCDAFNIDKCVWFTCVQMIFFLHTK